MNLPLAGRKAGYFPKRSRLGVFALEHLAHLGVLFSRLIRPDRIAGAADGALIVAFVRSCLLCWLVGLLVRHASVPLNLSPAEVTTVTASTMTPMLK
jgi:hypothetical protein